MKAYFLLFLTAVIFSGNIIAGKAMNDLPPFTIAFFRVLIAFVVILPLGWKEVKEYSGTFLSEWKAVLFLALTGVTFFNSFIYASLQFTSSTNVAIMEASIPVFTILCSMIFLRERLDGKQWIGAGLSLAGAFWVITEGSWEIIRGLGFNTGDVIMLAAVAAWTIYSILVKIHMMKFPVYGSLVVMLAIANIVLLPIAFLEWSAGGFPDIFQAGRIAGLLYLGIFPSLIALVLWNKGVEEVGPSRASVFLNLLPVFVMAGAFFLLGETVTLVQFLGALVVISGVVLTTNNPPGKKG
ncbi:DMT family transporter [Salibacterium halotolerans]|nr:EamA family transporter [Salibacterium halotolerans]